MDDSDGRVVDFSTRQTNRRPRLETALADERIRNLAYQAAKLPTTLSRSQIEELGVAVLTHLRRYERIF